MPSPVLGKLVAWISQMIFWLMKYTPTVYIYFLSELSALRVVAWRKEPLQGLGLVNALFSLVGRCHWKTFLQRRSSGPPFSVNVFAILVPSSSGKVWWIWKRVQRRNWVSWDSSACERDEVGICKAVRGRKGGCKLVTVSSPKRTRVSKQNQLEPGLDQARGCAVFYMRQVVKPQKLLQDVIVNKNLWGETWLTGGREKPLLFPKYRLYVCLCKFLIHSWLRHGIHGGKKHMLVLFLYSLLSFCFCPWLEVEETSWAFCSPQHVCFMFFKM